MAHKFISSRVQKFFTTHSLPIILHIFVPQKDESSFKFMRNNKLNYVSRQSADMFRILDILTCLSNSKNVFF